MCIESECYKAVVQADKVEKPQVELIPLFGHVPRGIIAIHPERYTQDLGHLLWIAKGF
jgi:hypothetical protein